MRIFNYQKEKGLTTGEALMALVAPKDEAPKKEESVAAAIAAATEK